MPSLKLSKNRRSTLVRKNIKTARSTNPGQLGAGAIARLREMTVMFGFSLALGDFIYLDGSWYVTHAGLLRLALRKRCAGIEVQQVLECCDQSISRWVFKATVYKTTPSVGFVGYGDADPTNVSSLVHGAEMRVAETRAVNRALRKAYGIGLCSLEELGSPRTPKVPSSSEAVREARPSGNGSNNGGPRLRDQLSMLIRQHNLNPTLVKAYASDFCGVKTLSAASRDLVESFISHLTVSAKDQPEALICRLNSYAQPEQAQP